jgi:hypothetical protein
MGDSGRRRPGAPPRSVGAKVVLSGTTRRGPAHSCHVVADTGQQLPGGEHAARFALPLLHARPLRGASSSTAARSAARTTTDSAASMAFAPLGECFVKRVFAVAAADVVVVAVGGDDAGIHRRAA